MTVKSRHSSPDRAERADAALPAWMTDAMRRRNQPQQQHAFYAPPPQAPRYEDEAAAEEAGDKVWVFHF